MLFYALVQPRSDGYNKTSYTAKHSSKQSELCTEFLKKNFLHNSLQNKHHIHTSKNQTKIFVQKGIQWTI